MSRMSTQNNIQEDLQKCMAVFDCMIGQKLIIETLKTAVAAYSNDKIAGNNPTPENTIAVGPAGVGKTKICKLAHKAYGFPDEKFHETLGTTLTQETLISTLLSMDNESTLYIDEAMGLSSDLKQILLKALEEGLLLIPDQKKSKIHKIPLDKFHCCLSMTDEYMLEPALRQRFPIYLRFQLYNDNEIISILTNKIKELEIDIEDENLIYSFLSTRSRKTPRIAIQHLNAAWRVARSENSNKLMLKHAKRAMEIAQIFEHGCSINEIKYLSILKENLNTPTRLNILSSKMALPKRTITEVIENWLVQSGLIEKLSAGRILTDRGIKYINNITYI